MESFGLKYGLTNKRFCKNDLCKLTVCINLSIIIMLNLHLAVFL